MDAFPLIEQSAPEKEMRGEESLGGAGWLVVKVEQDHQWQCSFCTRINGTEANVVRRHRGIRGVVWVGNDAKEWRCPLLFGGLPASGYGDQINVLHG